MTKLQEKEISVLKPTAAAARRRARGGWHLREGNGTVFVDTCTVSGRTCGKLVTCLRLGKRNDRERSAVGRRPGFDFRFFRTFQRADPIYIREASD